MPFVHHQFEVEIASSKHNIDIITNDTFVKVSPSSIFGFGMTSLIPFRLRHTFSTMNKFRGITRKAWHKGAFSAKVMIVIVLALLLYDAFIGYIANMLEYQQAAH